MFFAAVRVCASLIIIVTSVVLAAAGKVFIGGFELLALVIVLWYFVATVSLLSEICLSFAGIVVYCLASSAMLSVISWFLPLRIIERAALSAIA